MCEIEITKMHFKVKQCIVLTGLDWVAMLQSSTYVVHIEVACIAIRTPLYIVCVLQSIKVYVKYNLSQGMHPSVCMLRNPW